jgi:hypothetical protein
VTVQAVRPTQAAAPSVVNGDPEQSPSLISLMPAPCVDSAIGGDPLSALYLFEAQDENLTVEAGASSVQSLQTERNDALHKEQQAIVNEDQAAKHRSFWDDLGSLLGDVAKVAGLVASVAAVVATAGAAAPVAVLAIAGVILSSASMADGEFHVLQKFGVDESAAGWIDTGLSLAAGASTLCLGGVAAGAQTAGRLASGASSLADIGQGVATIEAGQAQAVDDRATADEVSAQAQSSQSLRFIQLVIDETQALDDTSTQIKSLIVSAMATQQATVTNAAIAVKG